MLNVINDTLADAEGDIVPAAIAETLKISLGELARLVGVSRNTLAAKPLGSKARDALEPVLHILSVASEMTGSEAKAAFWFRYNPILSMGTRTAMEHVADGRSEQVMLHLRSVAQGGYA